MEQQPTRRLTKGRDRIIGGVASGLAEYFDLEPTIVRALWVVLVIFGMPLALIGYVVLMVIMPARDSSAPAATPGVAPSRDRDVLLLGGVLVVMGLFLGVGDMSFMHWIGWGLPHVLVPILLIVAGAFLLLRRMREG